jgi:hypothetical protein
MLETLTFENVQSHVNTTIALHEHVNAIIGTSDSGKSSMVRGINWLTFNEPTPDDIRRHDAKRVSVLARFTDCTVKRTNASALNGYILNDNTKAPFEAIGRAVPEEIQNALQLSDVNFQMQGDQPYLISLKGGDVSRELNAAAGIDEMDTALSNMQSLLRVSFKAVTVREQDLKLAEAESLRYATLEEHEDTAAVLQALDIRYNKLSQQRQQLYNTVCILQDLIDKSNAVQAVCDLEPLCVRLEAQLTEWDVGNTKANTLWQSNDRYRTADKFVQKASKIVKLDVDTWEILLGTHQQDRSSREALYLAAGKYYMAVDKSEQCRQILALNETFLALQDELKTIESYEQSRVRLQTICDDMRELEAEINDVDLERERGEMELEKAIPDVCPLCLKENCKHV